MKSSDLSEHPGRTTDCEIPFFQNIRILNHQEKEASYIKVGEVIYFEIKINPKDKEIILKNKKITISIWDKNETLVCKFKSEEMNDRKIEINNMVIIRCSWNACMLVPGTYSVTIGMKNYFQRIDRIENAIYFEVRPNDIYGTGKVKPDSRGYFIPEGKWEFREYDNQK